MINFCGIAGVLFAFVGLVLIAVSGSLPQFVDIFLVQNEADLDVNEPIGGVGVFTSFYDPTTQDPALIAAGGVPDEPIDTDTLDFPLLFPAEFNFAAQILPVDADLALALQELAGEATVNATVLTGLVDDVLELDAVELGCETYSQDLFDNLGALSSFLQDPVVFPGVMESLRSQFATQFLEGVGAVQQLMAGNPAGNANTVFNVLQGTIAQVLAGFAGDADCDLIVGTTVIAQNETICLAGALGLASTAALNAGNQVTAALLGGAANVLVPACQAAAVTVDVCFSEFGVVADDTNYADPVTFAASTVAVNSCELLLGVCVNGVSTKAEFFVFITGLLNENLPAGDALAAALLAGAGISRALVDMGIIDVAATTTVNLGLLGARFAGIDTSVVPPAFSTDFELCLFFQVIATATGVDVGAVDGEAESCTVSEFFAAGGGILAAVGEDANAALFGLIGGLYGTCEESIASVGIDFLAACPGTFTQILMIGGFAGSIDQNLDQVAFVAGAAQECENDIEDSEKVAQAQASLITSFVFYGLNVIVSPFAFLVRSYAPLVYGFAAASALFAGIGTIAALLIVQSAPVYEGVGGEIVDGQIQIVFQNGLVALIALLDAVLMFVTSGCFIGAVVIECMCQSDDYDEEEDEDEKKDEDVGSPAAAAQDDYKVVAANGEEVGI